MSIQGNIREMSVADLIQHNCIERKKAKLVINQEEGEASIYFNDGNVVHASLGNLEGEEVIFHLLTLEEGAFALTANVETPKVSIDRSWSGLLLEGAKRVDETGLEVGSVKSEPNTQTEVKRMAKLDDILKEMSAEVTGYVSSALVGMDGINIASHTSSKSADPETISAQMTMLLKLVDTSMANLGAGVLEDNLVTSENAYILMRYLPGKQYFLCMAANIKTGNLGNMRLISKLYTERLSKAMTH